MCFSSDRAQLKQFSGHNDPDISQRLSDLETNPPAEDSGGEPPQFVICDDLLYYSDMKVKCGLHLLKALKLYAPESIQGMLLAYYHDYPTAGHLGMSKTLARLQLRFFWPKMAADIKRYVSSCSVCQLTKPSQRKPAGLMVPILPQKPWEYTGIDFVRSLVRTASGNTHLLVFVNYFSKWIEVCAVREAAVQVAAAKFVSEVFARHGALTYLISDRGSPFVSEVLACCVHPRVNTYVHNRLPPSNKCN